MSEASDTETSGRKERGRSSADFDRMSEDDLQTFVDAALDRMSVEGLNAVVAAAREKLQSRQAEEQEEFLREVREKAARLGMRVELLPLQGASGSKKTRGGPGMVAPKYRGPDGNTWTGRGRPPKWMEALMASGRKKEEFLIT
jgi:DNA-binding protein H-NS